MERRVPPKSEAAASAAPPFPDDSGLAQFLEPDDHGLSLDELSQAYAALLARGADPYAEPPPEEQAAQSTADELPHLPASQPVAGSLAELEPLPPEEDGACPVTPRSIVEAILFVGHPAGQPLTSQQIAGLMRGVRPTEIDEIVDELNEEYASAGAPYTIVSSGAGYQMVLRPQFSGLRATLCGRIKEAKLSQGAIDVLAIVAYRQPITAEAVDQLRGKPSGAILSQLVRRNLLMLQRPERRDEKPTYRTTERFLDFFGLDDLSELPRSHEADELG